MLGNGGPPEAVPALAVALNGDKPLVRGHGAWVPGWIPAQSAADAFRDRLSVEEDGWVVEEIELDRTRGPV